MSLSEKTLAVFNKRTFEWTGILQRMFREFIEAANVQLSEKELNCLYLLPDYLIDLVQTGLLEAIELQVGSDSLSIRLSSDPDVDDDLDLSLLPLCDFSGKQFIVHLMLNNTALSQTSGVTPINQVVSKNLLISIKLPESSLGNKSPKGIESHNNKVWRVS